MNSESGQALRAHEAVDLRVPVDPRWRSALPLLAAACVCILAVHWSTVASLVAIWDRSETFAHGYLILPISLFLVWRKRAEVARLTPAADPLGFVLLAAAAVAWLVASAGQVQVVQQYAMVAMIPAAVIAIAGRDVARALAFPLGFLLLAVPIGEALVPPLMDWTAHFTVVALQLTGIPVFQEGTFFTIPSGRWSVVEGCSGLRYLIASVTVGVLFAYLNYSYLWKRALFVLASIIVPIIANGLRAYMIVMIAHLSDMKLALGVDHLIYGWVFFGIVMLLLFWVGSFWRDPSDVQARFAAGASGAQEAIDALPRVAGVSVAPESTRLGRIRRTPTVLSAVIAVGIVALPVVAAAWLQRADPGVPALAAPSPSAGWTADPISLTAWRPRYEGERASVFQTYRKGGRSAALYLGFYRDQRRGAELVTSTNIMVVQKHPVWSNMGEASRREDLGKGSTDVRETKLRSPDQRLLVWDWYRIAGRDLTNPYLAKLLLARDRLLGRGDDAAAIIIAAPYDERPETAEETLRQFTREMLPSIDAALARASGGTDAKSQ